MKKILSLILAFVLCLSLCGCEGNGSVASTEPNNSETVGTEEDSTANTELITEATEDELLNFPFIGTWATEDCKGYLRVVEDGTLVAEAISTMKSTTTINGVSTTTTSKSVNKYYYVWCVENGLFLFNGKAPYTPYEENGRYILESENAIYYRVGELDYEIPLNDESDKDTAGAETEQMSSIAIGQTVVCDDYEFTLKKVEFSYEVLPQDTSGSYFSYPAESGKVYVHVVADVKNTMQRDIRVGELFETFVLYDGKYNYEGFTIVDDGASFNWGSSYVAAIPLETCRAHGLVECPAEVDNSGKPISVRIQIGDTTYEFNLR